MSSEIEKIAPFRFSTDSIPSRDRMAVFREVIGRLHMRVEVEPLGDGPVRFNIERHKWAAASLLFCETSPLRCSRTPQLLQGGDDIFLLWRVEGARYEFSAIGVSHEIDNPDAILATTCIPKVHSFLGTCRLASVSISRKNLTHAKQNVEDRPVRRIDGSSLPMRLLKGYIGLLQREGPANDPALRHQTAQHLIDLAALALDPTKESQIQSARGLRGARLAAVRADVLANLSQVSLSVRTVAQRHGITGRYIHRLFEETGQTFGGFVLETRLKRAMQLLTDPARAGMRISDIATETGFGDISTFNRAFRRRFGDTPRGVRHSTKAQ
jgi:AraC-like DNA-binding protein